MENVKLKQSFNARNTTTRRRSLYFHDQAFLSDRRGARAIQKLVLFKFFPHNAVINGGLVRGEHECRLSVLVVRTENSVSQLLVLY